MSTDILAKINDAFVLVQSEVNKLNVLISDVYTKANAIVGTAGAAAGEVTSQFATVGLTLEDAVKKAEENFTDIINGVKSVTVVEAIKAKETYQALLKQRNGESLTTEEQQTVAAALGTPANPVQVSIAK